MPVPPPLPILVVEDDPLIARTLVRALDLKGIPHLLALGFEEGSLVLGPFAAAIIDIHLPDGNGLNLYQKLLDRGMDLPAVFFSATLDEHDIARAEYLGIYVSKSKGVVAAVQQVLAILDDAEEVDPPKSTTRNSTPKVPVVDASTEELTATSDFPESVHRPTGSASTGRKGQTNDGSGS